MSPSCAQKEGRIPAAVSKARTDGAVAKTIDAGELWASVGGEPLSVKRHEPAVEIKGAIDRIKEQVQNVE